MKPVWDKKLEEYTFNELVDWAVGVVIFGIASGETIHALMFKVVDTVCQWKRAQK